MLNFNCKKYKLTCIWILFVFIFAGCIYYVIKVHSTIDKNQGKVSSVEAVSKPLEEKVDKDLNKDTEVKFIEMTNYNIISPSVQEPIKQRLMNSVKSMKAMAPGVGPWKVIYCNDDKIVIYNYAHIVACDISENNKGIYAIIELKGLKVGSYQGSEVAEIYVSPGAKYCIIGTGCWEMDTKSTKSLYACSLEDSTAREIAVNYNVKDTKLKWYIGESSSLKPCYAYVEGNNNKIIWDFENGKGIDAIPTSSKEQINNSFYEEKLPLETGYVYYNWLKRDENTFIASPYKKGVNSFSDLNLGDFQIIEIKLKEKECRILFKL